MPLQKFAYIYRSTPPLLSSLAVTAIISALSNNERVNCIKLQDVGCQRTIFAGYIEFIVGDINFGNEHQNLQKSASSGQ